MEKHAGKTAPDKKQMQVSHPHPPNPHSSSMTHLIKVEQHFSAVQLVSFQTHPLVHQQLLGNKQGGQAGDVWVRPGERTRTRAHASIKGFRYGVSSRLSRPRYCTGDTDDLAGRKRPITKRGEGRPGSGVVFTCSFSVVRKVNNQHHGRLDSSSSDTAAQCRCGTEPMITGPAADTRTHHRQLRRPSPVYTGALCSNL